MPLGTPGTRCRPDRLDQESPIPLATPLRMKISIFGVLACGQDATGLKPSGASGGDIGLPRPRPTWPETGRCSIGTLYPCQGCRSERKDAQLHKQSRGWGAGRVMGDSPDTRRTHTGHTPGITLILPEAPPALGGARDIKQVYG